MKYYRLELVLKGANSINKINQCPPVIDNIGAYDSMQSDSVKMMNEYSCHKHGSQLFQEVDVVENRRD